MQKLVFIAMRMNTAKTCAEQLHKLLYMQVNVISYGIDQNNLPDDIEAELVLFASNEAYVHAKKYCSNCTTLIARRAINYHEVSKLFSLHAGTDVLLVNDLPDSTNSTIALLQTIGIDHINYHPCCPQMNNYPHLKTAITPGEIDLVPDFVEDIIDIKTRLIDLTTIVEVLIELGLLHLYADFLSANYVQDIIRLSKKNYNRSNEILQLKAMGAPKRVTNRTSYTFSDIVGKSSVIVETIKRAKQMANAKFPVLIQGESGTGKELIAQSLHSASSYSNGPFVAVNFTSLSESLLESELFGYVPGAFTGAKKEGSVGLFEEANHGTLFLDEIGDAPLSFQVKLLRVLQEKQIRRVGANKMIPIDVRIITATNQNLLQMVEEGLFRKDLYYRLNVLPIEMPPLRKRGCDVMLLTKVFYQRQALIHDNMTFSVREYFRFIVQYLLSYNWPGNIRELENTVQFLTTLSPDKAPLPALLADKIPINASRQHTDVYTSKMLKQQIVEEIESANKNHKSIGRRSLAKKLNQPENKIRKLIEEMRESGVIISRRGRSGLLIDLQNNK